MRAWLYDWLTSDTSLQEDLGGAEGILTRVMPRRSQENIPGPRPFLVYGMGTNTNEDLAEDVDHEAARQFFQIWIHDEGGDYNLIESIGEKVKARLVGASDPASRVTTIRYLETSQEFNNETYNTLFRYLRFQAIISKGRTIT